MDKIKIKTDKNIFSIYGAKVLGGEKNEKDICLFK